MAVCPNMGGTMKIVLNIVGVLLFLMGAAWTLQGFNFLPGSFMSGRIQYAILGIILGIAGILIMVFTNRRRKLDT
jgi:hypothetical protein